MYFEIDDYNALRDALHQMCAALLARNIPDDAVFDSKLVADELLSNVLQHGGGRAFFRAEVEGNEIRLCVRSESDFRPPEESVCSPVTANCGRGLFLVDAVCASREYREGEGIRVVIKIGTE